MLRALCRSLAIVFLTGAAVGPVTLSAQAGGNAAARAVKNPVAVSPASLKTGEALYMKNCQFCHGPKGLGDGKLAPKDVKPANLTDATWTRGATDGEIHANILNGIPEGKMPAVKGRLSDTDVWHVVNYLRSLGPAAAAR